MISTRRSSIYSERLGQWPSAVVRGKYAMWSTDLLNFSINEMPERPGQLPHVGFEDGAAQSYSNSHDVNGIEWESFSARKTVGVNGVLCEGWSIERGAIADCHYR